jgi:hypothetical protein
MLRLSKLGLSRQFVPKRQRTATSFLKRRRILKESFANKSVAFFIIYLSLRIHPYLYLYL